MIKALITHPAFLTREESLSMNSGQSKFWLKDSHDRFIPIGINSGLCALRILVHLDEGEYILGCGTGAKKLRRKFTVDLMGAHFK